MTQTSPTDRLAALGIKLPEAPKPVASYVPTARSGNFVFVSGQVPIRGGQPVATGRVPDEVSEDAAIECAKLCAVNALACLQAELGSLDRIAQIVRVGVFVASAPGYGGQPTIANGVSDLLVDVFGESGKHARAAVGCSALPLNVPVEVELTVEVAG